jgi:RNA polymerase primary sigma factor
VSDPVDYYLREIAAVPVLTPQDEINLAKRIQGGGEDAEIARKELIESNLPLVVHIAKRYANGAIDTLDLIMEGNTALLKAAHEFNPARNYRFSTFAEWFVRRAIRRESKR